MNDKSYFYIGGAFSIALYILFFLIFLLYIKSDDVRKIDARTKTTVLELNIVVNSKTEEKQIAKATIRSSQNFEEIVKKSTSKSVKTTGNIQSLFANVTTQAKDVRKEIVNNIERNLVSSRFQSKFEKEVKNDDLEVSKILDNIKQSNTKLQLSDASEQNDPYYSKIYEILSSAWNPRVVEEELFARVILTIYSDGRFDFRFLKYSNNSQFNNDLEEFLTKQTNILFPSHNKGNKTDIDIIFKSKETV